MMDKQQLHVPSLQRGEPLPLGASLTVEGINFAVFASRAESVDICIFDADGVTELYRLPLPAHTAGVWHGLLPVPWGQAGLVYGFRVHGAYEPARGLRHNPAKLLIDPYAHALRGELIWHPALNGFAGAEADNAADHIDSAPYVPKCVVMESSFDWQGDHPPSVPWRDSIFYEVHVKGFTMLHPEVPVEHRGTYLGMAHPAVIDHLQRLGVTAVELMPVQEFVSEEFLVSKGLRNYWGYNSLAWSAPARAYATAGSRDPIAEFKTMVSALHAAGIEVILDVVFNHTAEGNEFGPTLSWRGFDNAAYYTLQHENPRWYVNRSGCGNTVAVHHPATLQMIIDSLRYWVEEMHVDGFRFDLAPVLGRDDHHFRSDALFFQMLRQEPALRYVKLIAEPWDVGPDGYQLGRFPNGWAEWNDLYRDTMRGFWRGNPGRLGNFAERFAGSSDLFRSVGRKPTASINFITCHDGFSLQDLVSYNDKHNEANLEGNRDGHNYSLSWNCGVEGPTDDAAVLQLRKQQVRNLLATLLCSQGVPMLWAGDEFGRTQMGNNNAYCQDNPISWVDWSLADKNADLLLFVRQLIHLRKQAPGLRRDTFLKGARGPDHEHKDISWRHPAGHELDAGEWHDDRARCIGVLIGQAFVDLQGEAQGHLLLLCNTGEHEVSFALPIPQRDVEWRLAFDTSVNGMMPEAPLIKDLYIVQGHSMVMLSDGLHERRLQPRNS
ncbi:MAG: glycogen debranching protein GlgX [Steroidobacteraceae bacterium]